MFWLRDVNLLLAKAAPTCGCHVDGPPEDPTDSVLHVLPVAEVEAFVEHVDLAEVQPAFLLAGLSFLLRHSTQNLRTPKNRTMEKSSIHSFIHIYIT